MDLKLLKKTYHTVYSGGRVFVQLKETFQINADLPIVRLSIWKFIQWNLVAGITWNKTSEILTKPVVPKV